MAHDKFSAAGSPVDVKTCTKCGEKKPLDEFHKRATARDGRKSQCKRCVLARAKNYQSRNDVKRRRSEYRSRYYQENKEQEQENLRNFTAKHPERIRGYKREQYSRDPEKYKAKTAAHSAKNPHQRWESSYRVRCRKFELPIVIESFTREELVERWGDACIDCGDSWSECEHDTPVVVGGAHTLENCRPICRPCNLRRWHAFQAAAVAHYSAHPRATTERPS